MAHFLDLLVLPLATPGLCRTRDFHIHERLELILWPIIVLNSSKLYTLPVGLKTLQDANLASFKLLMSGG